jgi:hypothetical protein
VNITKSLAMLGLAGVLAGCNLEVIVTKGGDVVSDSGTRNCSGGRVCEFEINDTDFAEGFTAQARDGYVFTKWASGEGFLCADSVNPTCVLNNTGAAGNSGLEGYIESDGMLYIMPTFEADGTQTNVAKLDVQVTSGLVVVNSSGDIMGKYLELTSAQGDVEIRVANDPFVHKLRLGAVNGTSSSSGFSPSQHPAYESLDCTGEPILFGSYTSRLGSDGKIYVPDMSQDFRAVLVRAYWHQGANECRTYGPFEVSAQPAIATDIVLPDGAMYIREL